MERRQSLRWRLALSYAGIALLANLALGILLLSMLRLYYQTREQSYLMSNATAVSQRMAPLVQAGASPAELIAQLRGYSFLLQTRIQLFDQHGRVVADSGMPGELELELTTRPAPPDGGVDPASSSFEPLLVVRAVVEKGQPQQLQAAPAQATPAPQPDGMPPAPPPPQLPTRPDLPAIPTLYGFNLGPEAAQPEIRSPWTAEAVIEGQQGGRPLGSLQLSHGPSYGAELVGRVALAWLLASGLATIVAAAAGWRLSLRTAAPLMHLTETTMQMAAGDLAVRAAVERADELGRLARSFNRMAERVETMVETLRRFVSDAAHEINTPLTALQSNLDLAIEDAAQASAFITLARADAERIETLANDLLDLSRLESADQPLEHDRRAALLDLRALLGEAYAAVSSQAEQAEVTLDLSLPEQQALVFGRSDQLRRAVQNLLDNAIKFTPPGGRVRLALEQATSGLLVTIADTGVGIPPDEAELVFQRFHRGRNAAKVPGSGLGLAIVSAIVERHHARISVESRPGCTRFLVRLPAAAAAHQQHSQPAGDSSL